MKGGFNKILRNIVAGSSDTEYEKVSRKKSYRLKQPCLILCVWLLKKEINKGNIPSGFKGT